MRSITLGGWKPRVNVPHLREDPDWAAKDAELQQLRARRAELRRLYQKLLDGASGVAATSELTLQARAEAYRVGAPLPTRRSDRVGVLNQELAELSDEMALVDERIKIVERELERETWRVSRAVCHQFRDEYVRRASKLRAAILATAQAAREEAELREALHTAGILFSSDLVPLPYTRGRTDVDYDTPARHWLTEAERQGVA
jgi:hypothetical protein